MVKYLNSMRIHFQQRELSDYFGFVNIWLHFVTSTYFLFVKTTSA